MPTNLMATDVLKILHSAGGSQKKSESNSRNTLWKLTNGLKCVTVRYTLGLSGDTIPIPRKFIRFTHVSFSEMYFQRSKDHTRAVTTSFQCPTSPHLRIEIWRTLPEICPLRSATSVSCNPRRYPPTRNIPHPTPGSYGAPTRQSSRWSPFAEAGVGWSSHSSSF